MRECGHPFETALVSRTSRIVGLVLLSAIVPWLSAVGAMLDEAHHLGFTNWQSACRGAGVSFGSLIYFTLELLPAAVIGALCGGLLLQVLAFQLRAQTHHAANCLAAHLGCVLTMPVGLLLCALAWPVAAMLLADVALAVAGALLVSYLWNRVPPKSIPAHP